MTSRLARAYARAPATRDELEHLVARGRWGPKCAGSLGGDVWAYGRGPDAFHVAAV